MMQFKQVAADYTVPLPDKDITKQLAKMAMQHSQQIVLLQSMIMEQNQENAKTQAIKQQQNTQIKQLQQMFMQANQQQAIAKSKEEVQQ